MTNLGQVITEVIAVSGGVGPGVVLIDQVSLPVAFLDNVEVQSDRRTVDEAGPPGAPTGTYTASDEGRGDERRFWEGAIESHAKNTKP